MRSSSSYWGVCGLTLGTVLRFLELQAGRIVIDGHDISTVALDELRTRLVLIPQDASLFAGTIRLNLDPFGEFEDHQLWDALRRVQLVGRKATSRPDTPDGALTPLRDIVEGLDHEIAEGGKNLSSGQRQLVALARGLLKLQSCNILLVCALLSRWRGKVVERRTAR